MVFFLISFLLSLQLWNKLLLFNVIKKFLIAHEERKGEKKVY